LYDLHCAQRRLDSRGGCIVGDDVNHPKMCESCPRFKQPGSDDTTSEASVSNF
jgi:hypothetical protein